MANVSSDPHPADSENSTQIFRLAKAYQRAAELLHVQGCRGEPLSWIPCRLAAIHSIELFLNALLLEHGSEPTAIRGMQHSFKKRAEHPQVAALNLRKRTAAHLQMLEENREYLVARYAPGKASTLSQLNRVMATLEEIAKKVAPKLREKTHAGEEKH